MKKGIYFFIITITIINNQTHTMRKNTLDNWLISAINSDYFAVRRKKTSKPQKKNNKERIPLINKNTKKQQTQKRNFYYLTEKDLKLKSKKGIVLDYDLRNSTNFTCRDGKEATIFVGNLFHKLIPIIKKWGGEVVEFLDFPGDGIIAFFNKTKEQAWDQLKEKVDTCAKELTHETNIFVKNIKKKGELKNFPKKCGIGICKGTLNSIEVHGNTINVSPAINTADRLQHFTKKASNPEYHPLAIQRKYYNSLPKISQETYQQKIRDFRFYPQEWEENLPGIGRENIVGCPFSHIQEEFKNGKINKIKQKFKINTLKILE